MLETITRGFRNARHRLQGYRELDEDTLDEVLTDIRQSLLEADVEIGVVRRFLDSVKTKALGEVVQTAITGKDGKTIKASPQDHFIKICHDELVGLMDPGGAELKLQKKGVSKLMMVGLQGSGKTTTAAKLENLLLKQGHRPLLVAADIYRPAAVDQLKVLGDRLGVPVFHEAGKTPPELCELGYLHAQKTGRDVVIFDTAGRLTIDQALMDELAEIRRRVPPDDTILVIDAMIGQDAVQTAKAFHEKVGIGGVALTKLDGDARGGAALSVKVVTGAPILFAGMGEGLDKLEAFRPEGMASRILGMGDIVGLMTDFEKVVDEKKAEEDAKRMLMGKFTLVDFLEQIKILKKMGSLKDVMEKLPFFGDAMADGVKFDDKQLGRIEAMIQSMTPAERKKPELIAARRLQRIARGSGHKATDVQDLLQRYGVMKQMMARIGQSPGMLAQMPGFSQMGNLSKMKGMGLDDFFGGIEELAAEARAEHGLPGGRVPLPGMPGAKGIDPRMLAAMGQQKVVTPPPRKVDRDHRKTKNKMAAQARKKNRRK